MGVDGKLSRVRIDAMRQMQVVVLAPLKMVERWALIAASLPILVDALISRRVGSMVARDGLSRFDYLDCMLLRFCFGARVARSGAARVRFGVRWYGLSVCGFAR